MLISLAFLITWKQQLNYSDANQNHILRLDAKIDMVNWKHSCCQAQQTCKHPTTTLYFQRCQGIKIPLFLLVFLTKSENCKHTVQNKTFEWLVAFSP